MKTFISLLFLIVAVAGGYVLINREGTQVEKEQVIPQGWRVYENKEFGFSIHHPENWIVDEYALDQSVSADPFVTIAPPDAEPMVGYITIGVESRNLDTVNQAYMSEESIFIGETGELGGQAAVVYKYAAGDPDPRTIYTSYKGKTYRLGTGKHTLLEIQQAIASFRFI
jgi:hypothetical protein